MENTANRITLTGTLASLPEYSHQNHERKFFRFLLSVDRLSGTEDLLPVLAAEDVLAQADLFAGERFTIEGQIRSFNNREPVGRRLILCVYALSLTTTQEPMQNEAVLTGTVCKPPVYRQTPLGRQITDLCLAVPRLYRIKFGRDIYKDLRQLEKSVGENDEDNSNLDLFSLEMFEDLAWLMARHADPANVPDSPEEFLDQFNTFSIYQILPQLIELWGLNVQTEVESRKNLEKVSGK